MSDVEVMSGARVTLRAPDLDDAELLFERVASDPQVTRYLSWRPHPDVDETRRVIAEYFNVGGETLLLRPSFQALVAAEEELGPLFALVERAADGKLALREVAALFDHASADRSKAITRERIGEAIVAAGLADVTPVLRVLLGQILQGR